MKYLSEYMNDKQTEAFNKHGAFFAFSNKQLDEHKIDGVDYVSLGAGLIAPKDNAESLVNDLDSIYKTAIKQDIEENGIKDIIWRELANHECQITYDYSEVTNKLQDYGITEEQIKAEWPAYFQNCIDNDYF